VAAVRRFPPSAFALRAPARQVPTCPRFAGSPRRSPQGEGGRNPQGRFCLTEALTTAAAKDYIGPLGRATAWRDDASAKPLTVYTVNHPAMSYGHVGCAGIGGSGFGRRRYLGRRNRRVSGCLTSESEERETWTAESLRAASSNGELRLFPDRRGHGRDFGGRRFRSTLLDFARLTPRGKQKWDLVKRCDQPRSVLSNLRV
jgi:hypothetical protein